MKESATVDSFFWLFGRMRYFFYLYRTMVWFSILQLWHIHGVLLVRQQGSAYLGFDQITVFSILLLLFAMAGVLIFFMLQ